jgi:RNA polymerase sigma factor (sigma-70 family)
LVKDERVREQPTRMLLQDVARARAAGDWTAAKPQWEACIARARARVEIVVDGYVWKKWIRQADRDDVVQRALLRAARRLVVTLDSLEERAFFAAVAQCADFQCRDDARKELQRRESSLIPESWDDAGDAYGTGEVTEAELRYDREAEMNDASERVYAALDKLPNPRRKKLLTMQLLGATDAMIAEELGTTTMNVHTMRLRALKDMNGLMES